MSRAFVSALAGIAMTIAGYFGPWTWPAWPAFAVLHLVFGRGNDWLELEEATRTAVLVGLITVNAAVWGLLTFGAVTLVQKLRKR